MASPSLPTVDLSRLIASGEDRAAVERLGRACREYGFFYITGHGVDESLCGRLERLSREFFAWDLAAKMSIRMELGGAAWRGYFPVGAELTKNRPDQKEGLYFGAELPADDPRVAAGVPLHGPNLFPDLANFRQTVLQYMAELTRLGHLLMSALARSLGLPASYFDEHGTRDPLVLFRIFHYPPLPDGGDERQWSVGEHTDYGLLTILRQDDVGGLQIKSQSRWIDAPPLPGSLICNLGDMLDRMTGGRYRSTPHRVVNRGGRGRLSFPFFFDPSFDAPVQPIDPALAVADDRDQRWDRSSVHDWNGTYGDYLLRKVSRVFPQLSRRQLPGGGGQNDSPGG